MATTIRDLCPIHGMPMWYTPMDGTYACQRVQCEATQPVEHWRLFPPTTHDYWTGGDMTFARMQAKTRWLYTQPNEFPFRGPIT